LPGDVFRAIEYLTQDLAIVKEVGDRVGEGRSYGNLGNAYGSLGAVTKAIGSHKQHLAMAKEVSDRAGEGGAYASVGICYILLNEYVNTVAFHEASHVLATENGLAHVQARAALGMGVALRLEVRVDGQGPAARASQAPGPHTHWSASSCLNDKVREATKWLQATLGGGEEFARLHLAHLTLRWGKRTQRWHISEEHLSWRVQCGREICAGCT
jgi:hypothetical protein